MTLKPLSAGAVPAALVKAERYRLLNEPGEAESICLDVLGIEPGNQKALVMLILALTDQMDKRPSVEEARLLLGRLSSEYERAYYAGIICEREAKAYTEQNWPGSHFSAYHAFLEAMGWYERAEAIRPPDNDDAVLRWNTCARFLLRHPHLRPAPEERSEPILSE